MSHLHSQRPAHVWGHQKVAVSKNGIVHAHEYKQIISAENLHEPEIDVSLLNRLKLIVSIFS